MFGELGFITMPAGMELMIILMVVVLLFGAAKIPQLARSSGQAMGEFKRGREEIEREIRDATRSATEAPDEAVREDADVETA